MKFFVVFVVGFCAVTVCANPPAMVNTGHSAQFRSQDSLGNYAFGYNEDHATGGTFRRETGSPGMAHGSYGLRTIDGRVRVVNYVADGHGFRANIQTNEPGVEDQDPASVLINKAAAIVAPYITKNAVSSPTPIAIQQSIENPVISKYEPAPIIESAPYISGAISGDPAILNKYDSAPLIESVPSAAPLLSKYEPADQIMTKTVAEAAPVLSTYTTKTYASPDPILSSDSVYPLASSIYGGNAGYASTIQSDDASIYAGKSLGPLTHLKK